MEANITLDLSKKLKSKCRGKTRMNINKGNFLWIIPLNDIDEDIYPFADMLYVWKFYSQSIDVFTTIY